MKLDKNKNYIIEELKKTTSEEERYKNNIIKAKNCISSLLFNFGKLSSMNLLNDTKIDKLNTIKILNTMKYYIIIFLSNVLLTLF